mgnify:CR=1 FL=1
MACAVLACCPLAGIAAMVLGVMAMRVTEGERPRRRGRRLALAAVVIGSAMLIVDFGLLRWWQQTSLARMHDEMEQVVRTALDGATLGDVDVVLGEWAGNGALPRPEAVDRFGEALRQRLGRYRGMSIVNQTYGSMLERTTTIAVTFSFEHGDRTGAATFLLVPRTDSIFPAPRLVKLVVEDAAGQPIELP